MERGHDGDPAVPDVHLDPDAGVVATRALVETAESPRIEEHRVRVVQLAEHAGHGLPIEQRIGNRVHEVTADVRQDFVEQSRTSARIEGRSRAPLVLHQPSAGHQCARQHCRHDYCA